MANYSRVITDAGIALLTEVANANGTLELTNIRAGDGVLGATDPETLTVIISVHQTFDAIDVRTDANGVPFIFFVTTNAGLAVAYTRREVGIYARKLGDIAETLLMYLYAPTDEDADYIPVPESGIATTITFRVQITEAQGLETAVEIDNSIIFLALDRWADHLAGAGAVDQHQAATASVPGLMSAPDKTKVDAHINTGTPTKGTAIHGVATQSVAGFESAADKTKLDGIAAGAEVNQLAFSSVKVGSTILAADSKTDQLELVAGTRITLTPDAGTDKVTIAADAAPASHVGAGGSVHPAATQSVAGFESIADKTKLDGIAAGAEVNQLAFSTVKVGSTILAADSKTDQLEMVAGENVTLTPDAANDKVTIAVGADTIKIVNQTLHGVSSGGIAIRLNNQTGAPTVAGTAVKISSSFTEGFQLCQYNDQICGFVLDDGVIDGQDAWVVIIGKVFGLVAAGVTFAPGAYYQAGANGKLIRFVDEEGLKLKGPIMLDNLLPQSYDQLALFMLTFSMN